jgi:4'-phosphopantetheinyl transferase EntD
VAVLRQEVLQQVGRQNRRAAHSARRVEALAALKRVASAGQDEPAAGAERAPRPQPPSGG